MPLIKAAHIVVKNLNRDRGRYDIETPLIVVPHKLVNRVNNFRQRHLSVNALTDIVHRS
jgi:hypothetical protein